MAKDDYFVIVYKILAYLYIQLKDGRDVDIGLISNNSKLLDINESYWTYIMEHLVKDGYVEGVNITKAWGNVSLLDITFIQITPKGIEYLQDNSKFSKIKEFLKDIKDIAPFI